MSKKSSPGGGKHDSHSATPATVALAAAGIAFTAHAYHHDPANRDFGREAAMALQLDPEQVFKTLVAEVDGHLVVALVPVTATLDLKALAAAVGGRRAAMADPAVAERKTGYVLGQKTPLKTVVDETSVLFDTIFVSGGRRGFDIELAPSDLLDVTRGITAAIARG